MNNIIPFLAALAAGAATGMGVVFNNNIRDATTAVKLAVVLVVSGGVAGGVVGGTLENLTASYELPHFKRFDNIDSDDECESDGGGDT